MKISENTISFIRGTLPKEDRDKVAELLTKNRSLTERDHRLALDIISKTPAHLDNAPIVASLALCVDKPDILVNWLGKNLIELKVARQSVVNKLDYESSPHAIKINNLLGYIHSDGQAEFPNLTCTRNDELTSALEHIARHIKKPDPEYAKYLSQVGKSVGFSAETAVRSAVQAYQGRRNKV